MKVGDLSEYSSTLLVLAGEKDHTNHLWVGQKDEPWIVRVAFNKKPRKYCHHRSLEFDNLTSVYGMMIVGRVLFPHRDREVCARLGKNAQLEIGNVTFRYVFTRLHCNSNCLQNDQPIQIITPSGSGSLNSIACGALFSHLLDRFLSMNQLFQTVSGSPNMT